jgi:transketolase C-terminal domain/subunit
MVSAVYRSSGRGARWKRGIGRIVTVEKHFVAGGLGGAAAEVLAGFETGSVLELRLTDEFVMEVAPY